MRDEQFLSDLECPTSEGVFRFVILTLDAHAAGPAARVLPRLQRDFPGLEITIHAAAEWSENPAALRRAKADQTRANIVCANLSFLEEHIAAILPTLTAIRPQLDAFVGVIADPQIVKLTKMGDLDMGRPDSTVMGLLKRLKPTKGSAPASGEKQMAMLKRLPKILRFLPGKAQDLRGWFLSMQYWLGGSD